jgi:CDP-diacylglycerol--serine O-phosphatidyltransferase
VRPTTEARPVQIEDLTNRFVIHRLSARLLPLAVRLGIHPNAVSLAGLACAFLSGAAYYHWRQPLAVLLGFLLMCGWHVCDGLDGQLARATGKATAFGRVVDGVCDYLAFFAVLIPVAISFPDWQAKLSLALTAGAAHAIQAAWYEGEREAWKRRARGEFMPQPRRTTGHWIEAGHNAMERALGTRAREIDPVLAAVPTARAPYFAATAPLLRALTPVSANGRTMAIPLFCLTGHAEWYWYWELFGLSLFALLMAALLRASERRIVAGA